MKPLIYKLRGRWLHTWALGMANRGEAIAAQAFCDRLNRKGAP